MQGAGMDERRLRKVTTLLVALAALAERAASRALPVRWLVLVLLRYAETVSRNHVAEVTGWTWPELEEAFGIDEPVGPLGSGGSPADATALGLRLRLLAAILRAFLPPEDQSRHTAGRAPAVAAMSGLASRLARRLATSFGPARPAPDTS